MQINYLGHSCFKIKSRDIVLVTDPYDKSIGWSLPKTEAQIVTISHEHSDHNSLANIEGNPIVIRAPGEYEIAEISIFGWSTFHDKVQGAQRGKNTIYVYKIEEVSLCHLGDLGHKLDDKQLEEVNGVDVLFVPIGNKFTISPKEAVEVINQIEPRIVIPMHYQVPNLAITGLANLSDFLQEIGKPSVQPVSKLIITKTSLPEEMQVCSMLQK